MMMMMTMVEMMVESRYMYASIRHGEDWRCIDVKKEELSIKFYILKGRGNNNVLRENENDGMMEWWIELVYGMVYNEVIHLCSLSDELCA